MGSYENAAEIFKAIVARRGANAAKHAAKEAGNTARKPDYKPKHAK